MTGWLAVGVALLMSSMVFAETADTGAEPRPSGTDATDLSRLSISRLTESVRESVVTISSGGRDGVRNGLGTGFVISADGLIATNMHVIGEGRSISVRTVDNREYEVKTVHATQRSVDLAILRIDATGLEALPLADSDTLEQGAEVVAIGNPLGLRNSVVSGVVSARREIDGIPMIQLAIPIERGNSGGPLLDRHGRVYGILTLKSAVTDNLGFAVAINALKPLINDPNPIPMSRWLTIGALDRNEWRTVFGGNWRQRAGRISVSSFGRGFGGRALCLSTQDIPDQRPLEIAVHVKLEHDDGAAGLIFHADGEDKHYGFYPSSGNMRLTRFDGPNVSHWEILEQIGTPHYRAGEWNELKVSLEQDRIRCFVNDELVIESTDNRFVSGRAGLAKFRHTSAEFKGFQFAEQIPSSRPNPESIERILKLATDLPLARPPTRDVADRLLPDANATTRILSQRARELEQRAEWLRQLALDVQLRRVQRELLTELDKPDDQCDLLRSALLVARLDNEEIDIDAYMAEAQRMAREIRESFEPGQDEPAALKMLNKYLFEDHGFHGSRDDYYNRSNSYLNEVIDDREGLPISLAVLYMELARRLGLNVVGVGLPGHFVARFEPSDEMLEKQTIDVFDRGSVLTDADIAERIRNATGGPVDQTFLKRQTKRAIIERMLRNLVGNAEARRDTERLLRYIDTLSRLNPVSPEYRAKRVELFARTDRLDEAIADIEWFLAEKPDGVDVHRLQEFRRFLEAKRDP